MPDLLAELQDLFADLDNTNPAIEHINQIFELFKQHFLVEGVSFNASLLKIYDKKSKVPQFKGKPETFVHIVTREDNKSGLRIFDRDRANKVHWIKPVLTQSLDSRIYIFDKPHDKTGRPQKYFWFKSRKFVVILRNYYADQYLMTAFCVEELKESQYERWYKKGKCQEKPHIVCGARNLGIAVE